MYNKNKSQPRFCLAITELIRSSIIASIYLLVYLESQTTIRDNSVFITKRKFRYKTINGPTCIYFCTYACRDKIFTCFVATQIILCPTIFNVVTHKKIIINLLYLLRKFSYFDGLTVKIINASI